MKYELPSGHGLSEKISENLIFRDSGSPSLTDAQYAALSAGIGTGSSVLVVSPTSTGKTQIAYWAIANALETRCNAVYLVNYRALARQKFEDFGGILLSKFLHDEQSSLVLATGDSVQDFNGDTPSDPLRASLLVATYEKYLAMISSSGIPRTLNRTVIVCDEIQILGDRSRGQSVEILLTLIKNAGWKQLVGLSAVLENRDACELANWLDVKLVRDTHREKDLSYEYWADSEITSVATSQPEVYSHAPLPKTHSLTTQGILEVLRNESKERLPVIVFCMRKQDIIDLAKAELASRVRKSGSQKLQVFPDLPETSARNLLSETLPHNIAIHSADLTDDERKIVEDGLLQNEIDVVFTTSTLAAGVNFPLGAAIFDTWVRWDADRRSYFPIPESEFHNMAGRVGRMGFEHQKGRVIFRSSPKVSLNSARRYLDLRALPAIESQIGPEAFDQLALQLIASGLCINRTMLEKLVCTSFSGLRQEDRNLDRFKQWPGLISQAINLLIDFGFVVESDAKHLIATPVGRAVGHAALLPRSANILLGYMIEKATLFSSLLPRPGDLGDMKKLAFLVFAACFATPEFRPSPQRQPTRHLPWPLSEYLFDASQYTADLLERFWQADRMPVNAASLCVEWIDGGSLAELEKYHSNLSAGALLGMFRNLSWALQGISAILIAATDIRTPAALRPPLARENEESLSLLGLLPRVISRLSYRVSTGLPDNVLWMDSLNQRNEPFYLNRSEIIKLRQLGQLHPEQLMLGTPEADAIRREALAHGKSNPQAKANWLRDRTRAWKTEQRKKASENQSKKAKQCPNVQLIAEFYESTGDAFEHAFEKALKHVGISFERIDNKSKTGAPDYLLSLTESPPLIFELKSREGDKLVDFSKSVEVLAAAELHGYRDKFCVTLCHPGVDPSVPINIARSGRLSVVESADFGEALLRICQGRLTQVQLWKWLATPGQAVSTDLPFTDHILIASGSE